jgi:hypothetical protein
LFDFGLKHGGRNNQEGPAFSRPDKVRLKADATKDPYTNAPFSKSSSLRTLTIFSFDSGLGEHIGSR